MSSFLSLQIKTLAPPSNFFSKNHHSSAQAPTASTQPTVALPLTPHPSLLVWSGHEVDLINEFTWHPETLNPGSVSVWIHAGSKGGGEGMIRKLNRKRDYDHVSWYFLRNTMKTMGFAAHSQKKIGVRGSMITWIKTCINTTKYSK